MRPALPSSLAPPPGGEARLYEVVLALFGAVCWGLAPVAGKVGLATIDPVVGLALRTLMASALVLGFLTGTGGWNHLDAIPWRAWLPIGIEALLATLAGDLAYYAALKHGDASAVALVMAASPLVTVAAAAWWLGEPLSWPRILGAVLIVAGVALVVRDMGGAAG